MINPYADVDFASCVSVISVSHAHATSDGPFMRLYNGGCRHMALSNYRPSQPYYPLPYGGITTVPADAIACPNAEHFGWIQDAHFNGLGSTFASGSSSGGWTAPNWKYAFDKILEGLLYSDAGGITINHPKWTNRNGINLSAALAEKMLDYDERVLGVEAMASNSRSDARGEDTADCRYFWDEILMTGRRCWGFAVPDHGAEAQASYGLTGEEWTGQNVLLLPSGSPTTGETANHACLKAYRDGRFFCRVEQGTLAFTGIALDGNRLTVSTNKGTAIRVIEDGVAHEYTGSSAVHTVGGDITYCRIEADGPAEGPRNVNNLILSQPIIFRPYRKRISDEIPILFD